MTTLALDIGGANLKAAHRGGGAWSMPFALWRQPAQLADRLRDLSTSAPPFDRLLVTMTAELCDCFATKRQGVSHVLDAAEALAAGRPIGVWSTRGSFMNVDEARAQPLQCAAANWHALATFAARLFPQGTSLLVDTGSTTTDVIALCGGRPAATGLTDTDRLAAGELVYVGAARTPLAALGPTITLDGRRFNVMAELFATTADVYVLSGQAPPQPECTDTADGRPLSRGASAARVMRMIGADMETHTMDDACRLAGAFAAVAQSHIAEAMRRVLAGRDGDDEHDEHKGRVERAADRVIVSGSGDFVAASAARAALPDEPAVRLADHIGQPASIAACAHALLKLDANERMP